MALIGSVRFNSSLRHDTVFSFSLSRDETYLFYHHNAKSEGGNDVIIEYIPRQRTAAMKTTEEKWNKFYYAMTPLYVGDRVFFYGQTETSRQWIIQELVSGGKLGSVTAEGTWGLAYSVMRSFKILDRTFLIYHNDKPGEKNDFFIQEVLEGGQLGGTVVSKKWAKHYSVMVPLDLGTDQPKYIFCHTKEDNYWFIQEVSKDGNLGPFTDGLWDKFYEEAFSFTKRDRVFLYLSSKGAGGRPHALIREVLPNGTFGETTEDYVPEPFYSSLTSYMTVEGPAFYGQDFEDNHYALTGLDAPRT